VVSGTLHIQGLKSGTALYMPAIQIKVTAGMHTQRTSAFHIKSTLSLPSLPCCFLSFSCSVYLDS
jgi:hypothetical protein